MFSTVAGDTPAEKLPTTPPSMQQNKASVDKTVRWRVEMVVDTKRDTINRDGK